MNVCFCSKVQTIVRIVLLMNSRIIIKWIETGKAGQLHGQVYAVSKLEVNTNNLHPPSVLGDLQTELFKSINNESQK